MSRKEGDADTLFLAKLSFVGFQLAVMLSLALASMSTKL